MASISNDANGTRRILFVDGKGKRKAIRLGRVSLGTAEKYKCKVEALHAAMITNCSPDRETAAWVAGLGDDHHERLAAVGLVTARHSERAICPRLGVFVDSFISA